MTFLLRLFLLAAGLIFAASVAVAAVLTLALWGIRAAWAKLTGRPVLPFIFGFDSRGGLGRMYRRAQQGSRTPRADAVWSARNTGDVIDVEARKPGS